MKYEEGDELSSFTRAPFAEKVPFVPSCEFGRREFFKFYGMEKFLTDSTETDFSGQLKKRLGIFSVVF